MFGFLSEIEALTGLPFDVLSKGYRLIDFGARAIYIEGIKNIISLSGKGARFALADFYIEIAGEHITLKELTNNTVIVTGENLKHTISKD